MVLEECAEQRKGINLELEEGKCYSLTDIFRDGERALKEERCLSDGSRKMMARLMKDGSGFVKAIEDIWTWQGQTFGPVVRR